MRTSSNRYLLATIIACALGVIVGATLRPRLPAINADEQVSQECVTLLAIRPDVQSSEMHAYLRANGASVELLDHGMIRLVDSPDTRSALFGFLSFCQRKINTAERNVANMHTTRNAAGEPSPFERQIVTFRKDGKVETRSEKAEPILKYEPVHPDAGPEGYVAYPNIQLQAERAGASTAASQIQMATRILSRFEPSFVGATITQPVLTDPLAQGSGRRGAF